MTRFSLLATARLSMATTSLPGLVLAGLVLAGLVLAGTSTAAAEGTVPPLPPVPKFKTQDAAAHGRQIADYQEQRDSGWIDAYSKSKMTLIDGRGDSVTRDVTQMTLEGDSGDKSLSRFLSPADVRGVSALIHEHPKATDDSWLYLPASRRVRRISGANRTASFQGTEFTYEDLSSVEPSRYGWRFLSEETLKEHGKNVQVYKLEATPNYKDTGYAKLTFYVNKKEWRTEKVDYFDKAGRLLKTLVFSKFKHHHKRFWRATKLDMQNHQTRKRTLLETKAQFINLAMYKKKDGSPRNNLSEAQFTRRALESN